MSSTTLMTFLLSINPTVRSVKLFGSWDNFSKPYAMERDRRIGPGQWRGCHTFTDIICDGSPENMLPGRTGGLKMGGTYWYYYLLDDDIEYYNEKEPMTSQCPFLPGQPVNVLYVPIILPDSLPTHTNEDSVTSQRSDHRTMNPEDKFMNPRQPPKPKSHHRLRTSIPSLHQPTVPWSFSTSPLSVITNRTASQPSSSAGRDVRGHKASRSVSPPGSRGLRAAFRYFNSSSPDLSTHLDLDGERPGAAYGPVQSRAGSPASNHSHEDKHCSNTPAPVGISRWSLDTRETDNNSMRQSSDKHDSSHLSIRDRRALKTKCRDPSPLGIPLTLETRPSVDYSSHKSHESNNRSMKDDSSSSQWVSSSLLALANEPLDLNTPRPFFAEKRLPTLPNTPSSVMDEALRDLDEREEALDMEPFTSHFSLSTTDESTDCDSPIENTHFSEWSSSNVKHRESVQSTFNVEKQQFKFDNVEMPDSGRTVDGGDPDTPHLTVNPKQSPATSDGSDSPHMNLPLPHQHVSLSPSELDIPGLHIDDVDDEVETNPKRHAAFFGSMGLQGLGLSPSPNGSAIVLPDGVEGDAASLKSRQSAESGQHLSSQLSRRYSQLSQLSDGQFAGTNGTMKEMMDELSYLKNMIQAGRDGSNFI